MSSEKEFLEIEENPYNTENKGPEEIVRLFYTNDVPVLPVVSKRGMLLGILSKERVISELSDIERTGKQKIDEFIMKVSKKMTLDELLPIAGSIKEFTVINLFGEVFGKWSRLELFSACENAKGRAVEREVKDQKDEQAMEWMIFLVLEHIPRALYALNHSGKTIFYNSHFEDIYTENTGKEVDAELVEKSLADSHRNDFFYKRKKDKKDIYFYNKDMKLYYERIPLISNDKTVGNLFFVDRTQTEASESVYPGVDMSSMSLAEMMSAVERSLLVDSIKLNNNNVDETAKKLYISKKVLLKKIDDLGIDLGKIAR